MSANSAEFAEYVMAQLAPIKALSCGRFFAGLGLACDSVQFAMLMGNALFFVVDDSTRGKFEAKGMGCFWYTTKKGRINVKKYYEVPAELLEDPETLQQWARESITIARRLKKKK